MPQEKKSDKTYRIPVLRMETNYGVEITYRKYVLQARVDSEEVCIHRKYGLRGNMDLQDVSTHRKKQTLRKCVPTGSDRL